MKLKYKLLVVCKNISFVVLFFTSLLAHAERFSEDVFLDVLLTKDSYFIGEPIDLTISLNNKGTDSDVSGRFFNPSLGHLNVLISIDGESYKSYLAPGWGVKKSTGGSLLLAGQVIKKNIRVLYNQTFASENSISGFLAFSKPGDFMLKAQLFNEDFSAFIESESIQIKLIYPNGDDEKVWSQLNLSDDVYFLHTGIMLNGQRGIQYYSELLKKFPNSAYAEHLKNSIRQYKNFKNPTHKKHSHPDNSRFNNRIKELGFEVKEEAKPTSVTEVKPEPPVQKPESKPAPVVKPDPVKISIQEAQDNTLWYILAAIIAALAIGGVLVKRRS